ncbi:MFS transporter [Cumulibacter soli]|uniref:MFS transporter n=1 Tax=Cumulibacter soli TaxID=2546344 RepID=UPI001ABAF159|nr:MFS transporter [Cumulibacter soli]
MSKSSAEQAPAPNAVVAVLAAGGITAALMQTLVVPLIGELPTMLNTTASNASWVITVTLLVAAVATPVSGRLGDLYGKRRMMLLSTVALAAGSVVCALSESVIPMIVGRGLQGLGMGLIPLGISVMRDVIPAERLGTSIALMSASMGVGGALGLPIAAAVAMYSQWQVLFWGSAVLAVVIGIAMAKLIPRTPPVATGKFDPIGAIGIGIGLVCLLLAVSKGADWGWGSATTLSLLIASVVVFGIWGWYELRIDAPLVDLRVTSRPVVLLTNAASMVLGFAMFAQSLIYPQLLQLPTQTGYGLGQDMLQMGLWMMPGGLMMMVMSPLSAKLSKTHGPRITLAIGSAVVALGYLLGVFLMGSTWSLLVSIIVGASGVGLAYGAMPALIMGSVPLSETASANSFNTLMRSVGTSVASAVVGVVLANMTLDLGPVQVPSEAGFVTGLLIGGGVALAASVLALLIPAKRPVAQSASSDGTEPLAATTK